MDGILSVIGIVFIGYGLYAGWAIVSQGWKNRNKKR
jgi:hypothetical protein